MAWTKRLLTLGASLALVLGTAVIANAPVAASSNTTTLHLIGHFTPRQVVPSDQVAPSTDQIPAHSPMNKTLRRTSAAGTPTIAGNNVSATNDSTGWNGVSHFDQRRAGNGAYTNTQFSLEPPDQALCVGNGDVIEGVNNSFEIYTTGGVVLTSDNSDTNSIAYSQFWGLSPEVVRPSGPFGQFISDPKCYYDPDTNRFFMSELELDTDSVTGDFTGSSSQLLAVTATGDPMGPWNLYSFSTTDTRTGCGCFGDQPLIGADANGFYISTNEYGVNTNAYYGAQIYAISKAALAAGTASTVVHIDAAPMTSTQGGLAYSVQPATSPNSGYATANNGTEYFLSTTDWSTGPAIGVRASTVEVWALTNTASLNTASPNLALSNIALSSESYAQPPNATQASGSTPLAKSLHETLELLDANDDRMNQVVYANGKLWSGANSAVKPPNGPTVAGFAYFIVTPSDPSGTLSATMARQGYVGVSGENVLFPSIGVSTTGSAAIAFTLVGPDYHPSAAYARVSAAGGAGDIHIAAAGAGADDGFTAYKAYQGNGSARWGDYSAAVGDVNGNIWMSTEYIPDSPRTLLANWGTFVSEVSG